MKILLLSDVPATSGHMGTSLWKTVAVILLAIGGSVLLSAWYGYQLGMDRYATTIVEQTAKNDIHDQLRVQKQKLIEDRSQTRDHLNAFALRLGQMQSEILRINALGQRLADISNLDTSEFNFDDLPARGGISDTSANQLRSEAEFDLEELVDEMISLSRSIDDRERKLSLLEELLMNQQLQKEIFPTGSPVKSGWISSLYGYRKDPFTGKRTFHKGIDIAGRAGSKVMAVASGVVVFSGTKSGFGKVVEIRHGNGYSTRYGHNKKLFVEAGDLITRGQVLGLLGSTGRATGPHVHFEVALNSKTVDPQKFMKEID